MNKWKLMLTTLPYVALVFGAKLVVELGFQFPGVVEFTDVGVVLTGAVFLTGFLLSGTMADYKESEKIPGELASTLEAIEDVFVQVAAQKQLDVKKLRGSLLSLVDAVKDWFVKKRTTEQVFDAIATLGEVIRLLEKEGAPASSQLLAVRKSVQRVDVISRTGFLPPAYALLEVLLAMIVGLLMVAKFKSFVGMCILVPFVTMVNFYMLRLIKDIDDPFEYDEHGQKQGGAEVDLFPIDEYRARLAKRV